MNSNGLFDWLAEHEPPPDDDDTAAQTQELDPDVIRAMAHDMQAAHADDERKRRSDSAWKRYVRWYRNWCRRQGK